MTFDSDKYWIERGTTYREEFRKKRIWTKIQFRIQERYIENAINMVARNADVERVLDMGCGFGRITKMLCRKFPFASITGMDISKDQLNEARRTMGGRVAFYTDSITDFGYTHDNDLITVSEVLMHIPPDKIEAAIETLKLASNGFVITVDWWEPHNPRESTYCFQHPYKELFEAQGFELFSEKKIPFVRQKIRIWERI